MCTEKIHYKNVLTPQRLLYDMDTFSELAKSLDYPFYNWNGRIFATSDDRLVGMVSEVCDANTLAFRDVLYPHWRVKDGIDGMQFISKVHGFTMFAWNGRIFDVHDSSKEIEFEAFLNQCSLRGSSSCTKSCSSLPEGSIPIMTR